MPATTKPAPKKKTSAAKKKPAMKTASKKATKKAAPKPKGYQCSQCQKHYEDADDFCLYCRPRVCLYCNPTRGCSLCGGNLGCDNKCAELHHFKQEGFELCRQCYSYCRDEFDEKEFNERNWNR